MQIFGKLKKQLDATNALSLPGGIVLTGGVAALPGITDLAQDVFDVPVRVSIPDQMGLRHPSFTQALSLVNYRGQMSEVALLVQSALAGNDQLASQVESQPKPEQSVEVSDTQHSKPTQSRSNNKPKKQRGQGIKKFFTDFFD